MTNTNKINEPKNPLKNPGKPVEENVSGSQYESGITGAIKAKFDWIEERIKSLNNIMGLIIGVLFIGFFSLGFALAAILIQWWSFTANTQLELKQSIQKETQVIEKFSNSVNIFQTNLDKILTPSPTPK